MPGRLNRPLLPTLLGLLTLTSLFYYFTTASAAPRMPSARAAAPPLSVSLHQTNPTTLTARLTNTDATTSYTLVTWDTPLDPLALKLGLATIALPDGTVLDLPTIQVRRKYPPAADSIVTLAPGESREQAFALEGPVVPVERIREGGGRALVRLSGAWQAGVWAVQGGEPVGRMGAEEGKLGGEWASGEVEVVLG